jgi:hypothetical protein
VGENATVEVIAELALDIPRDRFVQGVFASALHEIALQGSYRKSWP